MEFVHPGEQTAWNALLGNKAFQAVVGVFQSMHTDLTAFGALKGRNFLVTQHTLPHVYKLYQQAGERLGMGQLPPLYLQMEYGIQIQTLGTDGDCAIMMNSACLEECSDAQLLALFGQELTHVRCQHLWLMNMNAMVDTILPRVPVVGAPAAQALKTLLLQWKEYAYYTADRGAAIAAADKQPVYENLTMAMGRKLDAAGVASVLVGYDDQQLVPAAQNATAKVVMQMMLGGIAVPFGMWRIRELNRWDADLEQVANSLEQMESYTTFAQKTMVVMDQIAKGFYAGAVKTAETVRQGAEELGSYIEENKPIWEENINTAKNQAVDTIKNVKADLENYVEENKPIWESNIQLAKIKAVDAFQRGKENLTAYVEENQPGWEAGVNQARQKAGEAVNAGAEKVLGFMKKIQNKK